MKYEELPEYISTLKGLKEQYQRQIKIHIELEIEYFFGYDQSGYYQELSDNSDLEIDRHGRAKKRRGVEGGFPAASVVGFMFLPVVCPAVRHGPRCRVQDAPGGTP